MAESLDLRLQEAAGNGLNNIEFLELVLQDELTIPSQRLLQRRIKAAAFREHRSVLLLGPPGTGKSHLVQAIDYYGYYDAGCTTPKK